MSVLLFGANPGLSLCVPGQPGATVAFASVWRVDWSIHGPGTALVVWHTGQLRLITETPTLGAWLIEAFTRHFPELDGLARVEPQLTEAAVRVALDPATGLRAEAADVVVEITEPIGRRVITVEPFPGNGFRLSNVYTPCRRGALWIAGQRIEGEPIVTDAPVPSSTAFLADAEVWCSDRTL